MTEDNSNLASKGALDKTIFMSENAGKVVIQSSLYAADCLTFLQQALDNVGAVHGHPSSSATIAARSSKSRYASSSEEDEEEGNEGTSSGASDSEEPSTEEEGDDNGDGQPTNKPCPTAVDKPSPKATTPKPRIQKKLDNLAKRQSDIRVRKYVDTLMCASYQIHTEPSSSDRRLCLPLALLSKEERLADDPSVALRSFQTLAKNIQSSSSSLPGKPIVVLFVRSGRFAGAVFNHRGECIAHHTKTTYTVRKGQGKAQSAQDSQRRPKSVGSQLRRQGEEKLQEDIAATAARWKTFLGSSALVLISCPKTMKKYFFDAMEGVLARDDDRIRRVPLDMGRPSFESVVLIHDVLTTVTIRESQPKTGETAADEPAAAANPIPLETIAPTSGVRERAEVIDIPLSALHVACKNGDLDVIRDIVASDTAELTVMAGPDLMTPLHFAAASTNVVEATQAAECVSELLIQGHANPSLLDGRGRPPYFLAAHDQVRDAFRIARSKLGESFCDWEAAKVGPPLTMEDLQRRKEKEAEKRRKKKARQKQKKAQDKAAAEEMEEKRKAEEEKVRQEEEAKRIRDGLQPQTNKAGNICDFCQTVCKGRKRNQMFQRLEYVYCSTECVQKHKRELMANAALARFGG